MFDYYEGKYKDYFENIKKLFDFFLKFLFYEQMANLKKIKDLAQQRGINLARIAEAADITPTGLSVLLRENSTRVETLEKIADFLGVPISTFFNDEPVPASPGNMANIGSRFHGNLNVGSDTNISRALDILEGQLKAKDEQISGLIKALNK